MLILLFRHGLAKEQNPKSFPDDDLRPLTPKGRKGVKLQAKALIPLLPHLPRVILASPTARTLATARILADTFGISSRRLREIPELHHNYPPVKAMPNLAKLKLGKCVALVGHEPWLSQFASLLVAGKPRRLLEIAKGGACLIKADAMEPGDGKFLFLLP